MSDKVNKTNAVNIAICTPFGTINMRIYIRYCDRVMRKKGR